MKEIKSSPLKQLGANPQEEMRRTQDQTDAGLDIIGGGAKRLAWEEMQFDIKDIEPESMKHRKMLDQILRDKERKKYESKVFKTSIRCAFGEKTKVGTIKISKSNA